MQIKLIDWAVDILEGKDVTTEVTELCQALGGVNPSKLSRLCTAISALLWECSKYILKEVSLLPQIFTQLGMNEAIIPVFTKVGVIDVDLSHRMHLKLVSVCRASLTTNDDLPVSKIHSDWIPCPMAIYHGDWMSF